jgi:hypothetical protein
LTERDIVKVIFIGIDAVLYDFDLFLTGLILKMTIFINEGRKIMGLRREGCHTYKLPFVEIGIRIWLHLIFTIIV